MIRAGQSRDLNTLYYGHEHNDNCGCNLIKLSDPIINTDNLIESALLNVFSGGVPPSGVEPYLWKLTYETLNKAVDEGFGIINYGSPDFYFIQELKHNNGVFAAFASYQQQKELAANLLDKNGKLKPYYKFKKDTQHIVAKHKGHRLTEYNTAVKRARSAAQFRQFQKTAHLYPNITWTPSRAANPDPIHRSLYGTTLPINHTFWLSNFPGNRWGCKCGWEVSDAEPTAVPDNKAEKQPGLEISPIKNRRIFSDSHPHIQRVKKAKRGLIEKEAVKLERKLITEWGKLNLKGKSFQLGNITANLTTRGIKEILNQPHRHYTAKNYLLFNLDEMVKNAEFTGSQISDKATGNIKQFHYFKIKINGEDSWLVVKEFNNGETQLYSIVDAMK